MHCRSHLIAISTRLRYGLCATLFTLGMVTAGWAQTQPDTTDEARPLPTLRELAATSEVIGIAQVYLTDYEYSHGHPVAGAAYLRMLITYRSDEPIELFRVKEKGLRQGECYFPTTAYNDDGGRFLVFLSPHPDGDYMGNPRLCMAPISVTKEQAYAMPYPRPELDLTAAGEAAVIDIDFADPLAVIDTSDMTRSMAQKKAQEMGLEYRDGKIIYTRGIPVEALRQLLGPENLKLPRLNR